MLEAERAGDEAAAAVARAVDVDDHWAKAVQAKVIADHSLGCELRAPGRGAAIFRQIAIPRLEGQSHGEIADELGISPT